jgi:hypothetical protein
VWRQEPGHGIHSEPWGNVGQEDATYFHFISKFYDDLPERMFFLHGHNKAWHQVSGRLNTDRTCGRNVEDVALSLRAGG